jgi:hypothetical protein
LPLRQPIALGIGARMGGSLCRISRSRFWNELGLRLSVAGCRENRYLRGERHDLGFDRRGLDRGGRLARLHIGWAFIVCSESQPVVPHAYRHAQRQWSSQVDRLAIDRDLTRRADRLEVPALATPSEHALHLGQCGLTQTEFALRTPTNPHGRAGQSQHARGGRVFSLDVQYDLRHRRFTS